MCVRVRGCKFVMCRGGVALALMSLAWAAVPECAPGSCIALQAAESNSGTLDYNVTGLEKSIVIGLAVEKFVLNCQEQDVEPARLPRFPVPTTFLEVKIVGCGAREPASAVLHALGISTTQLSLEWRYNLTTYTLSGLRLTKLTIQLAENRTVHTDALRGVTGLTRLKLHVISPDNYTIGQVEVEADGVGSHVRQMEVLGVKGAGALQVSPEMVNLSVSGCPSLAQCDCRRQPLPDLTDALGVVKLEVSCAESPTLPTHAPSLVKLTLWHAGSAPAALGKWAPALNSLVMMGGSAPSLKGVRLSWLQLSMQGLREVPVEVAAMDSLVGLDLTYNHLRQIPALQLPKLQTLYLGNNEILIIPDLQACVSLRVLSMRNTSLHVFPERLPASLERLEVSAAPLESGRPPPPSVQVVGVDCSRSALSPAVRSRYCAEHCARRMRDDNVTELRCASWPAEVLWPAGPVALWVESAGLQEVPAWPPQLRELYVSGNALRSLPTGPHLRALSVLDVRDNPLGPGAAHALLAAGRALLSCRCDALLAALASSAGVQCSARAATDAWAACGPSASVLAAAGAVTAGAALAVAGALYCKYRLYLKRWLYEWQWWWRPCKRPELDVAVVGAGPLAEAVLQAARVRGLHAQATCHATPGAFCPASAGRLLRDAHTHVLVDDGHYDAQVSMALSARSPAHRVVHVLSPLRQPRSARLMHTYLNTDHPRFWDKLMNALPQPRPYMLPKPEFKPASPKPTAAIPEPTPPSSEPTHTAPELVLCARNATAGIQLYSM